MSIQALRQAINAESDDPHSILQVLQVPWNGALNRQPYTDLLVVCAIKRKVEQIKMLGLLGADITAISTPGIRIKQAPKQMDELQQRAAARRAASGSTVGLTDPVKIHEAVLLKFRGQLNSNKDYNSTSNAERVAFKGTLIAHLENAGTCTAALPSMKRSLILDAGCYKTGYSVDGLLAALGDLVPNEPNSFFWCSLTGARTHAVDIVVRATGAGFELTTCNRGEGAYVEKSGKAGALRSVWTSAKVLAEKLAPWTRYVNDESMYRYNHDLHDVQPITKDADKPGALDYRPQKLQKAGNCATKSMFAALSYLTANDQKQLEGYKAFRRSFDAALSTDLQRLSAKYVARSPAPK